MSSCRRFRDSSAVGPSAAGSGTTRWSSAGQGSGSTPGRRWSRRRATGLAPCERPPAHCHPLLVINGLQAARDGCEALDFVSSSLERTLVMLQMADNATPARYENVRILIADAASTRSRASSTPRAPTCCATSRRWWYAKSRRKRPGCASDSVPWIMTCSTWT